MITAWTSASAVPSTTSVALGAMLLLVAVGSGQVGISVVLLKVGHVAVRLTHLIRDSSSALVAIVASVVATVIATILLLVVVIGAGWGLATTALVAWYLTTHVVYIRRTLTSLVANRSVSVVVVAAILLLLLFVLKHRWLTSTLLSSASLLGSSSASCICLGDLD